MESSIDWMLASSAVVELASYVVDYGLDDKDEKIFLCYLERCAVHGEEPADIVLVALGRKTDATSTESSETDYDYKVTEIKTQGFFVVDVHLEEHQGVDPVNLIHKIRSGIDGWLYDEINIIKTEDIDQSRANTSSKVSFLDRAFRNKPDSITKRVSFYVLAILPGDVVDENEVDLMSMIKGRLAENPAFGHEYLLTEELQVSDEDIVLIPI